MPTYQYVCTECGEPLEAVQKFSDDALTDCPACSGKLRKVFSAAGIIFKGSGFYRTDSRGSAKPSTVNASSNESSSNGDSAKSETTSSSTSSSSGDSASPSTTSKSPKSPKSSKSSEKVA